MKIGFIGLGIMGESSAKILLKSMMTRFMYLTL